MLDESLPSMFTIFVTSPHHRHIQTNTTTAFFLAASKTNPKQSSSFYFSQHGTDPTPQYSLRYPDPSSPSGSNRYACALYDSYNPDILFGEVLIIPEWTLPTLSQEAIRSNGGVPPPPEPILPTTFTIQLYNPDQQVVVSQRSKKWNATPQWEFEMPEKTFRIPSQAAVDRSLSDPAASDATPKLSFAWRKDGKLSKDLTCFLSGKSRNPDGSKKKHREPDITVGIFKGSREVTIYEPNMCRVDMEDPKGLEVVMLLSCLVIKDVFFGNGKEAFNITEPPKGPIPATTAAMAAATADHISPTASTQQTPLPPRTTSSHRPKRPSITIPNTTPAPLPAQSRPAPRPPPVDPRTKWHLDEEQRRIKKMLAAEESAKKKREDQVRKETELLKKMYGRGQAEAFAASQANLLLHQPHGAGNANAVASSSRPAQGVRFASSPVILGPSALSSGAYHGPPRVNAHTPAPRSASVPHQQSLNNYTHRLSQSQSRPRLQQSQSQQIQQQQIPRLNTPAAHGPYITTANSRVRPHSTFFHHPSQSHSHQIQSQVHIQGQPVGASSGSHLSVPQPQPQLQQQQKAKLKEKKSFFGFMRSGSGGSGDVDAGNNKLAKKRSSMF